MTSLKVVCTLLDVSEGSKFTSLSYKSDVDGFQFSMVIII